MTADLIGRVQRLLISPKTEWDAIDAETVDAQKLLIGYVAPLAAVAALAAAIGFSVFGVGFLGGTFRAPIIGALTTAVMQVIMSLVMVFVLAFIIDALAPTFGAQKNFNQAIKVAAYWPTAIWAAGVFSIIPMLSIVTLIGLVYSLYLLFIGLPKLMKPPADKATSYTIATIVVAIIASLIVGAAASLVAPKPNYATFRSGDRGALDQRAAELEAAAESGDLNKIAGAISGLAGVDADADVVEVEALRNLAPSRIAGLDRRSLEVESLNAPFKAVVMTAEYGEGDRTIELKVTNSPMMSAMTGMLGFAGGAYDRSSDDGYERLKRDGDGFVIEEWSKSSGHGRYGRTVSNLFLVEATGRGVDMDDIERATQEISDRELERLPVQKN